MDARSQPRLRESRATRAFTLIELLIVIAVIGILAAMLLPALNRGRDQAKRTVCINNLKQLNAAWHLYCDDNDDKVPPNNDLRYYGSTGIAGIRITNSWVWNVIRYESGLESPPLYTHADAADKQLLINPTRSVLGPYCSNPEIFHCPSDRSYIVLPKGNMPRVRSYSLNWLITTLPELGYGSSTMKTRRSAIRRNAFLFVEEHEDTIEAGTFEFDYGSTTPTPAYRFSRSLPSARHRGSGAVSFIDGSVQMKQWQDPATLQPVLRRRQTGGVASPGSPDVEFFARQNVY